MKLIIPRSTGSKVDVTTRALGSLSETIRTFILVLEYWFPSELFSLFKGELHIVINISEGLFHMSIFIRTLPEQLGAMSDSQSSKRGVTQEETS